MKKTKIILFSLMASGLGNVYGASLQGQPDFDDSQNQQLHGHVASPAIDSPRGEYDNQEELDQTLAAQETAILEVAQNMWDAAVAFDKEEIRSEGFLKILSYQVNQASSLKKNWVVNPDYKDEGDFVLEDLMNIHRAREDGYKVKELSLVVKYSLFKYKKAYNWK